MNFISNALVFFDFFKDPVLFNFRSKTYHSSLFGSTVSLIIYVYLLYGFFTSDMISRQNPIIVSQNLMMPHAEAINFNNDKHISIGLSDADNVYSLDPSIFTFTAKILHFENNENGIAELINSTSLELAPCNASDVTFDPSIFQTLGLQNQLCFANRTFTLEGYWDETSITLLQVNLLPCNNQTSFKTCKSQEEINYYFTPNMYFNLYYSDSVTDLTDFGDPIKGKFRDEYMLVDATIFKKNYIYLKNLEIQTNSGWYFDSLDYLSDVTFDSKEIDIKARTDPSSPLSTFTIFASHNEQFNTRRYQQIDDLFGNLSGTASFFIFIVMIVASVKNDLNVVLETMNTLYAFPIEEKKKFENGKIKIFKKMGDKPKKSTFSNRISIFQSLAMQKLRSLISFKKLQVNTKFEMGFFAYLIAMLKSLFHFDLNNREKIMFRAQKQFTKEMDVVNILSKLQEIEKLKKVIFSTNQYSLFFYLSKPMIPDPDKKESEENEENLEKDYEAVKREIANNMMNANLIKLIDQNIKECLKKKVSK